MRNVSKKFFSVVKQKKHVSGSLYSLRVLSVLITPDKSDADPDLISYIYIILYCIRFSHSQHNTQNNSTAEQNPMNGFNDRERETREER